MNENDFKIIDMPAMMARKVMKKDGINWIRDESWYDQIRSIYSSMFVFLKKNNLLIRSENYLNIDEIVVNLSDLTERGKKFIRSGADEKWLKSFDRQQGKNPSDTTALERALARIK